MITNFKDKKVTEYLSELEPGSKVLIRFGHGFGDTLMFIPILDELRRCYSKVAIDLYVECGQEEIFKSINDKDSTDYDLVFSLDFPMSEGTNLTKQEKCRVDEIGVVEFIEDVAELDQQNSPLVAVHFQGTALPGSVNCPEDKAQIIWDDIKEAGYIPIECHYQHIFHNPVNAKYGFIDRHIRDCKPTLPSLIGLLQRCHAFIGIASGPFVAALSIMPRKLFYLENKHKLETYTRRIDIRKEEIGNIEKGIVIEWLKSLK